MRRAILDILLVLVLIIPICLLLACLILICFIASSDARDDMIRMAKDAAKEATGALKRFASA